MNFTEGILQMLFYVRKQNSTFRRGQVSGSLPAEAVPLAVRTDVGSPAGLQDVFRNAPGEFLPGDQGILFKMTPGEHGPVVTLRFQGGFTDPVMQVGAGGADIVGTRGYSQQPVRAAVQRGFYLCHVLRKRSAVSFAAEKGEAHPVMCPQHQNAAL